MVSLITGLTKPLTTVELFAGIGGFRIAADRIGLKTVWANDINPISCSVYRERFGSEASVEGDIEELLSEVPSHDVLTAGFPCQPFSSAGKKEGTRDPRGTLFEKIVKVVAAKHPKFFVLENVKRLLSMEQGSHFATVLLALSELDYFVEWRLLNAKDFGLAQNRQRIVVTGTYCPSNGSTPDPREFLRLANQHEIYGAKRAAGNFSDMSSWPTLEHHGTKFPNWGVSYKGKYFCTELKGFPEQSEPVLLKDVLQPAVPPEYDLTEATIPRLTANVTVDKFVQGVKIVSNQAGGARMGYTIFGIDGLAPTLTASTSRHYERYYIDGRYRRLTPIEYARLMGFPDTHCSSVKPYDQYGLLGNAVPPPMVEWVLRKLLDQPMDRLVEPETIGQMELLDA